MIKCNSSKLSRRKTESTMSAREKLLQLASADTVALEDILATCINVMSEDNCESAICELAEHILFGNNMPDAVDTKDLVLDEEELPKDESKEEEGKTDLDDNTQDDPKTEELDADEEEESEADESYLELRQLEQRIRRMERLMKNEKGLFDFLRKKQEPVETKLDIKTFQRLGKDFLEKVCDSFKHEYKQFGRVEVKSTYISCGWMNGARMLIHFNNGVPTWSMIGSDKAIDRLMPKGNMLVDDDGELNFADLEDWSRIKDALKLQSDFTRGKNDRQTKQWDKDRAAADTRAKQNRGDDDWYSNRMNPYTSNWI